jgi:peroxiredoxin (alkyl hydroperoxide reductase subunit C)
MHHEGQEHHHEGHHEHQHHEGHQEHERREAGRLPLIGEAAPAFTAETTMGKVRFPEDYRGKWVILFSHPADFTPVCTTEIMAFAAMQGEFARLGCELIGLSVDSTFSHIAWLRAIQEKIRYKGMEGVEVRFPIIADVRMEVARKYGMIQPGASSTAPVRAVFFIDPDAKVRALIYYPLQNGRNMAEIKRLLVALQTTDAHGVATPADWQPNDEAIVPPPTTMDAAQQRASEGGHGCLDWFLCLKKVPGE